MFWLSALIQMMSNINVPAPLAKYQAQGHAVGIAVMTSGNVGSPTLGREEIAQVREKEARASAAIIGAEFFWLGYDDEFLYDSPEVRRHVIDVIRQFRPDIILCPDKGLDYHPDHTRTGQIIFDTHVMPPIPLIPTAHPVCEKIHDIWFYDTPGGAGFDPDVYVDITDYWETKARMLTAHESQDAWMLHCYGVTLVENVQVQARLRGFQTGCKYAEGFRKVRVFPQSVKKDALLP